MAGESLAARPSLTRSVSTSTHWFVPKTGSKLTSCRRARPSTLSACATGRWPPPPSRPCSLSHPRLGFKKSFGDEMCAQADQHRGTRIHFLYRYMQFGARINRAPYDD